MITAEYALALAADRESVPPPETTLDDRALTKLDYLDAMFEAAIQRAFDGRVLGVSVPAHLASLDVLEVLRQRYEAGGWRVGAFPRQDPNNPDQVLDFLISFSLGSAPVVQVSTPPPNAKEKPERETYQIMPVPQIILPAPRASRLLIRMPTRGRPAQALAVLEKYRRMAGAPVAIEVVIDRDDETMMQAEVQQRLAALGCIVTAGQHANKIAACNGGRYADWDILALASDDMVPVAEGYGARIIAAMEEHFPYLDGAVFFSDGFQRSNLCTLPIMGRRLHQQFGYVYDPAYQSLFCDREQTDILQAMGRLAYVPEKIIEHKHHIWGKAEKDELYKRNDALEDQDKTVFELRCKLTQPHSQFTFGAPPLWLSLCVCTVPARRQQLQHLLDDLYGQIARDAPRQVEILVDDRKAVTIGEKRQALLERAKGHFIAFIDDDDGVAVDYVARVVEALKSMPDADCASLVGAMTTNGFGSERFEHSLKYDTWETRRTGESVLHVRTPNHLSAVRRELALRVGFVSKNHGEDHDYSQRLYPLLKKETSTGDQPLYFYWFVSKGNGGNCA